MMKSGLERMVRNSSATGGGGGGSSSVAMNFPLCVLLGTLPLRKTGSEGGTGSSCTCSSESFRLCRSSELRFARSSASMDSVHCRSLSRSFLRWMEKVRRRLSEVMPTASVTDAGML